jgi:hypothetical protein
LLSGGSLSECLPSGSTCGHQKVVEAVAESFLDKRFDLAAPELAFIGRELD